MEALLHLDLNGAGIGARYSDGKPSSIVNLTILDGRITAQSLAYGAGIDAGFGDGAGISNISVIGLVTGVILLRSEPMHPELEMGMEAEA
jgi:hypothetical protein